MVIDFGSKLSSKDVTVGVIGLGYVGLPLVNAFWQAGLHVVGFDIDRSKIDMLLAGKSYIQHFPAELISSMLESGRLRVTDDFALAREVDAFLICVPTPLRASREPDLAHVQSTAAGIAPHVKEGSLVVLESTTYPGTTREEVLPAFEAQGLILGQSIFVAYSPEREDPGSDFETKRIPKIVGGLDIASGDFASSLYKLAFDQVYTVKDADTAEAVKITENIFRAVNIALVNELKTIYTPMGVDIWEVIEAAKTKPFGYMPFYPGPGLGGHCIPIDPFYLSWRAKSFDLDARFVELAGEINRRMPHLVIQALADSLSRRFGKAMFEAKILVLGVAYKKNIDDIRESPSLKLMELIEDAGAIVDFYDPHCAVIRTSREHVRLDGRQSLASLNNVLGRYDAVLIATDHDAVDYATIVQHSKLVIDTRNATRAVTVGQERVVRA